MLNATKLKKSDYIFFKNQPFKVIACEHSKQGRAGAVVRAKLKAVVSGDVLSHTFKGDEKVQEADISQEKLQYLYADSQFGYFMNKNYEQIEIVLDILFERQGYLKEGQELDGVFLENKLIDINLPAKIELKVIESEPGVKGDSANSPKKQVKLETGLELFVPLFINQGDVLRINTETGEYVERVS